MEAKVEPTPNNKKTKNLAINTLLALMILSFSSCEIIGGIFKTGMGVGIFLVVIVVAIVVYIFSRIGRNKQ